METKLSLLQFRSRLADGATEKQPGEQATSALERELEKTQRKIQSEKLGGINNFGNEDSTYS